MGVFRFGPVRVDFMVAGAGLGPAPVNCGAPGQDFLADHRNTQDLPEEVDHLLRSGQAAQVTVDDDAVETVIDKCQVTPK